jgi:hypothetical protein
MPEVGRPWTSPHDQRACRPTARVTAAILAASRRTARSGDGIRRGRRVGDVHRQFCRGKPESRLSRGSRREPARPSSVSGIHPLMGGTPASLPWESAPAGGLARRGPHPREPRPSP